jgi:hypothetical protein
MVFPYPVSSNTMLDAVEKGLQSAGYRVSKLGRKTARIQKGNEELKVAIRTSRDRWIGSQSSGALHRSDIDAFAIGAVDSIERPKSVEIYLIPRTAVLDRWNARRAARREAGYVVGTGPSFIALDKLEGIEGLGSGLAEEFRAIAEVKIEGVVEESVSVDDVEVIDAPSDGLDQFKRAIADSAEKWLRINPARVKIDIHITIDG